MSDDVNTPGENYLSDPDYLLTLLTGIAKGAGGTIRISEEGLISITRQDVITLSFDAKTSEIVLRVLSMPVTSTSETYEN